MQKREAKMKPVVNNAVLLMLLVVMGGGCTMLRPPAYHLPAKDSLVAGDTVTLSENLNAYAIAQRYNVPMREIIALNDLKPPFIIAKGGSVILPSKSGIGVSGVASVGRVDAVELAPLSSSSSSSSIKAVPLESVKTEQPKWARAPEPAAKPVQSSVEAKPIEPVKTAGNTAGDEGTSLHKPKTRTLLAKEKRAIESASFKWPVDGKLISVFGEKGNGVSNDGVNIVAPKDAPVVAAAQGTVVYAGNEMKGYGNLVLIRHEGDWVTAYAHLDRIWVAKETVVAEGAMIGTVGASGGVKSPQLHFETRFDGNPIDPELVLRSR